MGIKEKTFIFSSTVKHFELSGKIYYDNVENLEQVFEDAFESGAREVVLSCKKLEMIDSSGLSVIVEMIKKLATRSGKLHFYGMNPGVEKIFNLTNLQKFVEIYPDFDSVRQALNKSYQTG